MPVGCRAGPRPPIPRVVEPLGSTTRGLVSLATETMRINCGTHRQLEFETMRIKYGTMRIDIETMRLKIKQSKIGQKAVSNSIRIVLKVVLMHFKNKTMRLKNETYADYFKNYAS